jgi:hypothetical protein
MSRGWTQDDNVTSKAVLDQEFFCPGCGQKKAECACPECPICHHKVDPTYCYCGSPKEEHGGYEGHPFVPNGCGCGFNQSVDSDKDDTPW